MFLMKPIQKVQIQGIQEIKKVESFIQDDLYYYNPTNNYSITILKNNEFVCIAMY